jgi:hypothetical protein
LSDSSRKGESLKDLGRGMSRNYVCWPWKRRCNFRGQMDLCLVGTKQREKKKERERELGTEP